MRFEVVGGNTDKLLISANKDNVRKYEKGESEIQEENVSRWEPWNGIKGK